MPTSPPLKKRTFTCSFASILGTCLILINNTLDFAVSIIVDCCSEVLGFGMYYCV